jgi:hypothetical protein
MGATLAETVFGLGLSRTGTKSLHAAGVILGYPAVHYPLLAGEWWFQGNFSAETLFGCRFVTDLPTPIFYRELDRAFPDARFVLTLRDPSVWIESAQRFFEARPPQGESTASRDLVRSACYGNSAFQRDLYLAAFMRHRESVERHFAGRPGKLLTIDVTTDADAWQRLSAFLGKPDPGLSRFPNVKDDAPGLQYIHPQIVAEKRQWIIDQYCQSGPAAEYRQQ